MEHKSDNEIASADGAEAFALVLGPVIIAAVMLVTAAAFAGGGADAPVALAPVATTTSPN